ncbi:PREDICTED: uncharacterized protein LOC109159780 [Ipomoea nil]|uniref:uncharacterized protein LOC109159780 n=1 Tax=Ipomoea nil TaxID=35883 RepID=UPI000901C552|nr:PREDICTED: uncharacterized protein LOC109159780 [Ipomoea nil]
MASSQIVLILKKDNPESFAGYRPICLCTFISKVFTRVLSSRLAMVLPKLIFAEQASFIQGRSIQDNVLLALELMQYIDKKCRGMNVVEVLEKLGFPTRFVDLVMRNLQATRLSILVNGVSCGFFQPT